MSQYCGCSTRQHHPVDLHLQPQHSPQVLRLVSDQERSTLNSSVRRGNVPDLATTMACRVHEPTDRAWMFLATSSTCQNWTHWFEVTFSNTWCRVFELLDLCTSRLHSLCQLNGTIKSEVRKEAGLCGFIFQTTD